MPLRCYGRTTAPGRPRCLLRGLPNFVTELGNRRYYCHHHRAGINVTNQPLTRATTRDPFASMPMPQGIYGSVPFLFFDMAGRNTDRATCKEIAVSRIQMNPIIKHSSPHAQNKANLIAAWEERLNFNNRSRFRVEGNDLLMKTSQQWKSQVFYASLLASLIKHNCRQFTTLEAWIEDPTRHSHIRNTIAYWRAMYDTRRINPVSTTRHLHEYMVWGVGSIRNTLRNWNIPLGATPITEIPSGTPMTNIITAAGTPARSMHQDANGRIIVQFR